MKKKETKKREREGGVYLKYKKYKK